ncbi:hypothetical protein D3C86_1590800 [compost metagenome]
MELLQVDTNLCCLAIECLAGREADRHIKPTWLIRFQLKRHKSLGKATYIPCFGLVAFVLGAGGFCRISKLQLLERLQAKLW